MTWSILSSALKTTSVPELLSRLLSFRRTVSELRPPRLYSVRSTTIGSLPCMMTLPARISSAIFIGVSVGPAACFRRGAGLDLGAVLARVCALTCAVTRPVREKPLILASFGDETEELMRQVGLGQQAGTPALAMRAP